MALLLKNTLAIALMSFQNGGRIKLLPRLADHCVYKQRRRKEKRIFASEKKTFQGSRQSKRDGAASHKSAV